MPTAPVPPVPTTVEDLRDGQRRYAAEAKLGSFATPRYRLDSADWGDPSHPAVVFVHGMADQMKSFCMVQARLVDAGFRCVGYELADGYHDGAALGHYGHPEFSPDLMGLRSTIRSRCRATTIAQTSPFPCHMVVIEYHGDYHRNPKQWRKDLTRFFRHP